MTTFIGWIDRMESDRKKQLHVTKHILKRFQACVPHVQRRPGIRNSVSVLIRHLKAPSLPPRARERGEERARESRRRQKRKRRSGDETYENFLLIIASWLWKAICFPCISIGVFHKFITRGNMSIDFHLCVARRSDMNVTLWTAIPCLPLFYTKKTKIDTAAAEYP